MKLLLLVILIMPVVLLTGCSTDYELESASYDKEDETLKTFWVSEGGWQQKRLHFYKKDLTKMCEELPE